MDFFINSAHAQAAGGAGGQGILSALMLPVLLLVAHFITAVAAPLSRWRKTRARRMTRFTRLKPMPTAKAGR